MVWRDLTQITGKIICNAEDASSEMLAMNDETSEMI